MKKIVLAIFTIAFLMLLMVNTAFAGDQGAYRGEAADPNYSQLGTIAYLSNPAGFHFWFTVSDNLGPYIAGHSYHNIYMVNVDDPTEWCKPIPVGGNPPRAPYNLVGHEGEWVYYKIWDTTTDTLVLP